MQKVELMISTLSILLGHQLTEVDASPLGMKAKTQAESEIPANDANAIEAEAA